MGGEKNNVAKTVMLVVGEIAGAGVISLPFAVAQAGPYAGTILLFCCGLLACYTGIVLSRCFNMVTNMEQAKNAYGNLVGTDLVKSSLNPRSGTRSPLLLDLQEQQQLEQPTGDQVKDDSEYKQQPYVYIGKVALGWFGEYIVMISQLLALLGVGIVFIILSGTFLNIVFPQNSANVYCYLVALVVAPLSWLESPKDFWQAALIAVIATVTVCVGSIVLSLQQGTFDTFATVTFDGFFTAYGVILFAFGGHSLFPSLQVDMAEPPKFKRAMFVGFTFIQLLYLPISIVAVAKYGGNVLLSPDQTVLGLFTGRAADALRLILTFHLVFAIVIIQNPISQLADMWLRVPPGFNIWRVLIRTNQIGMCLLIAVSVPNNDFLCVAQLVGGVTTSPLAFICPSLFYLALCHKMQMGLAVWEWIMHIIIIIIGVVGGVASTRSAVQGCPF